MSRLIRGLELLGDGWAPAQPVGAAVNDLPQHWQFSVDRSHSIYFASRKPGDAGRSDIFRSRRSDGRWQPAERLAASGNSADDESTPFIAPNSTYLLFERGGDLYLSAQGASGWSTAQKLPPPINSDRLETCPLVSPDGSFLFFVSNR